jgi:DegV family protein with EDD domain
VSGIAVITDSTCTLPEDMVAKYRLGMAPQVVIWEGQTLYDGVDITPGQFYERLATASVMPTTSQATVAAFHKLFAPHAAAGTPIVAVLISSKLSGTILSAEQAKQEFPGAKIEIIDSGHAGMSLGFQVLQTARKAESGASFEEVVDYARKARDHTGIMLVVDTLEFLHRGGRIGGAARLLGTILNFKPILEVQDGRIEPLERVRTRPKAYARIMELLGEKVQGHKNIRIAAMHAAAEEDAKAMLAEAAAKYHPIETTLTWATPAIGAHTGPGTLAMAYCVDL